VVTLLSSFQQPLWSHLATQHGGVRDTGAKKMLLLHDVLRTAAKRESMLGMV